MENLYTSLKIKAIVLFALLFLVSSQVEATHFRYGTVSWQIVSYTPTTRTVQFNITQSYRWSFFGNIPVGATTPSLGPFQFGDNTNANLSMVVTSINAAEDWFVGSRILTKTYNLTTDVTAFFTNCCRISSLQQGNNDQNYRTETRVTLSNPTNRPPVGSTLPIFYVQTGLPAAQIQLNASDPDNDPISFAISSSAQSGLVTTMPAIVTSLSSSGLLTINTNAIPINRQYAMQVMVSDNKGARIPLDFIIQVVGVSNPPIFDYAVTPLNASTIKVQPGTPINFTVKARDVDPGSTVSLNTSGIPAGASISAQSGTNPAQFTFSWTPTNAHLGTYSLSFSATDNIFVQTLTNLNIVVSLAPVFDVPPTPQLLVHNVIAPGQNLSFTVQATDPDPLDVCSITEVNGKDMMNNKIPIYAGVTMTPALPTASSNSASSVYNWTPTQAQWGHKHAIFTAQDSYGDKTDHEVSILVNTNPQFTSTPVTSVVAGQIYQYNITTADPDVPFGDALQLISSAALPAWLSLTDNGNGTGTLSGTPGIADAGTHNITLQVEDINHHTNVGGIPTQTFTIEVIPCVIEISGTSNNLSCAGSNNGAIDLSLNGNYGTPTFVWTGPDSYTAVSEDISGLAAGSYTVVVSSDLGCIETETFFVGTMPDVTPPTITCPDDIIAENDPGECSAVVNYVVNTTDNCGATATLLSGLPSGSAFPLGTTTVKWRTVENSGNSVTYNFENLNIGVLNGQDNWKVIGSGFTPPNANVNLVVSRPSSGAYAGSKAFFAADVGGNNRTFSSRINNSNFSFPTVQNTDIVVLEYDNDRSYWGNALEVGFDANNDGDLDEAGERTFGVLEATNGDVLSIYGFNSATLASLTNITGGDWRRLRLTVDLEANNGAGSISLSYRDLTNNGSWISPPGLQNINAGLNPLATNGQNASKINGMRYFHEAGESSYLDNISFTTKSTATCSFTVTVNDTEVPVTIAQNVIVQLDNSGNGSTTAELVNNGSNDACGIESIALSKTAFTCADIATNPNIVTLTVTDIHGNVNTATAEVTVKDEVPPVALTQDVIVQLDASGNGNTTAALVDNGSNDACGILSLELSKTAFTCADIATNPNIVTLTVTDNHGNVSTATATVTVKDEVAPVAIAQNVIVQLDNTGNGSTTAALVNNGSNDACGILSMVLSKTDFTCADIANPNTVTLTVTDNHGNVSYATATVTVKDEVPANVITKNITVQLDASGNVGITADQVEDGSSDACGIATMTVSPNAFTCSNVGNNTVTLTVTDVNGNLSSQTAVVKVEDNILPTWVTTAGSLNRSVSCGNAGTLAAAMALTPTATDNCTVSITKTTGALMGNTITNTWSATDANGNTSSALFTQVITITAVTIDASGSSTPVAQGSIATLYAQVTPAEAGISVTFKLDQGTVAYGTYGTYTATTDAFGVATQTVSGLLVEVYRVYAIAGDGCANSTAYLAVFDPNGSFVTGGGWITSPLGAYLANPALTGKANFGFVSKYKKGSNIPDGNTEFQFQTGNLNFSSSSYNSGSLVIAGKQAIYKGIGTINGVSGFSFMVSAVDGQVSGGGGIDMFRMKIWNTSTGAIVYDNNISTADNATPTTALGGGSVVIHTTSTKSASVVAENPIQINPLDGVADLKVYPNPFTDKLIFEFIRKSDSKGTLTLFDAVGRKLEVLFDQQILGNENYRVEYTPKDLSTNMILYRMTFDDEVINGKMIYKK